MVAIWHYLRCFSFDFRYGPIYNDGAGENRECLKKGCVLMNEVNELLNSLEEEDYKMAITFIQYLSDSRKKERAEQSKAALKEIQAMFTEDKGWDSEERMLEEMALFRKERNKNENYA